MAFVWFTTWRASQSRATKCSENEMCQSRGAGGGGDKRASLVGADRKKQMVLGSVDSLPGPNRFTSNSSNNNNNNKVSHKAFLSWGLLGKHTKKTTKKQRQGKRKKKRRKKSLLFRALCDAHWFLDSSGCTGVAYLLLPPSLLSSLSFYCFFFFFGCRLLTLLVQHIYVAKWTLWCCSHQKGATI